MKNISICMLLILTCMFCACEPEVFERENTHDTDASLLAGTYKGVLTHPTDESQVYEDVEIILQEVTSEYKGLNGFDPKKGVDESYNSNVEAVILVVPTKVFPDFAESHVLNVAKSNDAWIVSSSISRYCRGRISPDKQLTLVLPMNKAGKKFLATTARVEWQFVGTKVSE